MPTFCRCGCGRRVSLKGILTKPCSRKGHTSIDLKRMAEEQLRRLNGPDGLLEKYLTTGTYPGPWPRELEMELTDSKRGIYDQEDINVVQGMLRDDGHLEGKRENSERNGRGEFQVQVALGCTRILRSGMRTRRSTGRKKKVRPSSTGHGRGFGLIASL